MNAYIDQHRESYRVEPICKVLQVAPSAYRRHAARHRDPALRSQRARRDADLMPHIQRIWQENYGVYGAKKVWHQLKRERHTVARCTVERLMRIQGLKEIRRGKGVRTTIAEGAAERPLDRVNRQFRAARPNHIWVSDFTYVSTWQGWLYAAFVIDALEQRPVRPPTRERWVVDPSFRSEIIIPEHPLQRASGRCGCRTLSWQPG